MVMSVDVSALANSSLVEEKKRLADPDRSYPRSSETELLCRNRPRAGWSATMILQHPEYSDTVWQPKSKEQFLKVHIAHQ